MNVETLKRRITSLIKEFQKVESAVRAWEKRGSLAKSLARVLYYIGEPYKPEPRVRTSPTLYAKLKDIIDNSLKLLPDNKQYLLTSWNQWRRSVGEDDVDSLDSTQLGDGIKILDDISEFEKKSEEKKAPPSPSRVIRECGGLIDPQLYELCAGKDYHDVVTNAFTVLEDRIRSKAGLDPSHTGTKLMDEVFNPSTGLLVSGSTHNEREFFYLIFRGAHGFLRNPPSHRITGSESEIEPVEVMCLVDYPSKS